MRAFDWSLLGHEDPSAWQNLGNPKQTLQKERPYCDSFHSQVFSNLESYASWWSYGNRLQSGSPKAWWFLVCSGRSVYWFHVLAGEHSQAPNQECTGFSTPFDIWDCIRLDFEWYHGIWCSTWTLHKAGVCRVGKTLKPIGVAGKKGLLRRSHTSPRPLSSLSCRRPGSGAMASSAGGTELNNFPETAVCTPTSWQNRLH